MRPFIASIVLAVTGTLFSATAGTLTKQNSPDSIIIVVTARDKRPPVTFTTSRTALLREQAFPIVFPLKEYAQYTVKQINSEFGKQTPRVVARVTRGSMVSLSASGTDARAIRKQMAALRDQLSDQFRRERGYMLLHGEICENHAQHAVESAPDLAGLVQALGGTNQNPRDFAVKALVLIQSIRYDARLHGFRKPLATLAADRGDCDSKSTLFLSLMRSAYPSLGGAIVYIKGHAFAALALPPCNGDRAIRVKGTSWVVMEPVGPALLPLGTVSRKSSASLRTHRFTLRELPR